MGRPRARLPTNAPHHTEFNPAPTNPGIPGIVMPGSAGVRGNAALGGSTGDVAVSRFGRSGCVIEGRAMPRRCACAELILEARRARVR
jgi:hypothetical protein